MKPYNEFILWVTEEAAPKKMVDYIKKEQRDEQMFWTQCHNYTWMIWLAKRCSWCSKADVLLMEHLWSYRQILYDFPTPAKSEKNMKLVIQYEKEQKKISTSRESPRCQTCKYFENIAPIRVGVCHRYPPKDTNIGYAKTTESGWCGEWKRNKGKDVESRDCRY